MPVNEIVGAREEVTFRSGAVLTATMLEAAIGAQAAFLSLAYAGYGDGILAGMELADVGGALFLEPGILHAGGGFFLCHERVDLTAFIEARDGEWSPRPDNKLILRPEEVENVKHITRTVLKLDVLDVASGQDVHNGEMLLLTFNGANIQTGKSHLTIPRTLKDFSHGNHADVNVLDTPFACPGGTTYPPIFFRALQAAIAGKAVRDTLDQSMLLLLSAERVLPCGALETYCKEKGIAITGDAKDEREALYRAVCKAVDVTHAGTASIPQSAAVPSPKTTPLRRRPGSRLAEMAERD